MAKQKNRRTTRVPKRHESPHEIHDSVQSQTSKILRSNADVLDENTESDCGDPKLTLDTRRFNLERWTFVVVLLVACLNCLQTYLSSKSATAAKDAATTAARQLEMSQRPWLYTEVHFSQPERSAGNKSYFRFNIVNLNTGLTPAISVKESARLVLRDTTDNLNLEADETCVEATKSPASDATIFPAKTLSQEVGLSLSYLETAKTKSPIFFEPMLLHCVAYKSSLDDKWHYTKSVYSISRHRDDVPGYFSFEQGQDVDIKNMEINVDFATQRAD